VGGEVFAPVDISRVEPDCHRLPGVVIAELIISENGAVEAGRVLTHIAPDAKAAILAAVRQWRYRPATFNGRPVAVYFTVTLRGCP
jgi:outer membrane biosynthesis protein TonB